MIPINFTIFTYDNMTNYIRNTISASIDDPYIDKKKYLNKKLQIGKMTDYVRNTISTSFDFNYVDKFLNNKLQIGNLNRLSDSETGEILFWIGVSNGTSKNIYNNSNPWIFFQLFELYEVRFWQGEKNPLEAELEKIKEEVIGKQLYLDKNNMAIIVEKYHSGLHMECFRILDDDNRR